MITWVSLKFSLSKAINYFFCYIFAVVLEKSDTTLFFLY